MKRFLRFWLLSIFLVCLAFTSAKTIYSDIDFVLDTKGKLIEKDDTATQYVFWKDKNGGEEVTIYLARRVILGKKIVEYEVGLSFSDGIVVLAKDVDLDGSPDFWRQLETTEAGIKDTDWQVVCGKKNSKSCEAAVSNFKSAVADLDTYAKKIKAEKSC